MTIKEIIGIHYNQLLEQCSCDKVISQGRTECDILQDVCVTAIKKYKEKDIEEEEGVSYLKKSLFTEKHFQRHRLKGEIVIFTDNLQDIADK